MDFAYADEDVRFRDEVKAWLGENIPAQKQPLEGRELRDFDLAWQRRQYEGGWAGIAWPKEFGGRGLSLIQQMIWFEEYARAGAPWVGCLAIALNHAGPTLIVRGSEEQKAFHLPRILRGEAVWCQGFSEPNAGSDLAGIGTRGIVEGDELVVTGQKIWTSYAYLADYQELLVRTSTGGKRHHGLTWVICDMRLPGITVRPLQAMSGLTHFCEVFYDQVRIPLANVVGAVDDGWNVAMSTLSFERGTALIGYQMELGRAVEGLIELAAELRGPDGTRAAIRDDEIARNLGRLRAEAAGLRSMTYATISRGLRQAVPGPEGAIVSLYFGELSKRVHRTAMDLLGPYGLDMEGRHGNEVLGYLESFKHTIAAGTAEIRRNIIGERVLGLAKGN